MIPRPIRPPRTLWTLGYEGRTPEGLIEALEVHRIEQLVDVRELPLSRRKGFSKTALSSCLAAHGIVYLNQRALGAPKEVRRPYKKDKDLGRFRKQYRGHLEGQHAALQSLAETASRKRTALLCLEKDPDLCHRALIAEALQDVGFAVEHI